MANLRLVLNIESSINPRTIKQVWAEGADDLQEHLQAVLTLVDPTGAFRITDWRLEQRKSA